MPQELKKANIDINDREEYLLNKLKALIRKMPINANDKEFSLEIIESLINIVEKRRKM